MEELRDSSNFRFRGCSTHVPLPRAISSYFLTFRVLCEVAKLKRPLDKTLRLERGPRLNWKFCVYCIMRSYYVKVYGRLRPVLEGECIMQSLIGSFIDRFAIPKQMGNDGCRVVSARAIDNNNDPLAFPVCLHSLYTTSEGKIEDCCHFHAYPAEFVISSDERRLKLLQVETDSLTITAVIKAIFSLISYPPYRAYFDCFTTRNISKTLSSFIDSLSNFDFAV